MAHPALLAEEHMCGSDILSRLRATKFDSIGELFIRFEQIDLESADDEVTEPPQAVSALPLHAPVNWRLIFA